MEIKQKFEWRKSLVGPTMAVLVILVILNMVSRNWFGRMDLTKEKMYTLSESSRTVVDKIDDLMTMQVYFSEIFLVSMETTAVFSKIFWKNMLRFPVAISSFSFTYLPIMTNWNRKHREPEFNLSSSRLSRMTRWK